ncbi:hypothetical protein CR513_41569, partial [Mucuna pruriens]
MTDEVDCDEIWEVHNLSNSEDDNTNLADLSQEAELLKLLDQVCKHEDSECSNNAEVQVVETKKLFPAQVATMFMTESSANILYDFDLEIELTLRRIRKVRNTVVSNDNSLNTSPTFENSVSTTNTANSSYLSTTNSFSSLNNS